MGNANGGGSGSFREEHIISASYYKRPLAIIDNSIGDVAHHGVVV